MTPASPGLDHTIVAVADLEAARATYARLGFTLTPRGSHIGWATANYCIMFPADYVELLGVAGTGDSAGLDRFLARRQGLMGLALKSLDASISARALAAAGVAAGAPQDLARRLELPEGTTLPRFGLVDLPPEFVPGAKTFLCQHRTPELMRRPEWLRHANGARAIAAVSIVVPEPEMLATRLGAVFGPGAVEAGAAGALRVRPETGAHLDVMSPAAFRRAAPATAQEVAWTPDGPALVGFDVVVAHLPTTAAILADTGIAVRAGTGRIDIPAAAACGCPIGFVAA